MGLARGQQCVFLIRSASGSVLTLPAGGDHLTVSSSPNYAWQIAHCDSGTSAYMVDTLAQKCLQPSGNEMVVQTCSRSDQTWEIKGNDNTNTYTIQSTLGGDDLFLSLDDRSFRLSTYAFGGEQANFEWAFQVRSACVMRSSQVPC
jgi:hypothetical protein